MLFRFILLHQSIGVITYVLLSGLSPFMGEDDNETLKNVTIGVYDYEDEDGAFDSISDDVKSFIDECLTLDPKLVFILSFTFN